MCIRDRRYSDVYNRKRSDIRDGYIEITTVKTAEDVYKRQLYGGADLFVVGQYDDSASVAAVAIGSQVMQTITGIILGITTGTTVLLSLIHI